MSQVDQEKVLQILGEALELDDPTQRDVFLASACAHDAELRRQVEKLLGTHDEARQAFEQAAGELDTVAASKVGPYHLLNVIGEGGMGVVYRAEQLRPVKRIVAIKLIKLGMDTEEVVARFESERQALAMMSHPNVARVFDAGATETGRPYFVMEYVAGEPITAFSDKHRYTIRQRLELFIQACEAVQHAHQKAILHRDIKPSNILVTLQDGKPLVKVIDFGIAKAMEQRLTDRTLFTEHGRLIGTPEYVSPEQAQMAAHDIDTRSDVYSLGVVLYELLTGALPFDPKTLRGAGYHEIQRILRETDPPRPSTRLSSLGGEDAAQIAQRRQTQLAALQSELRSELEWIPLKAMRKERAERYESAADLAHDIQNYLHQRPLVAGPPTAVYRARKFLARHKLTVAAAAAVLLALAAGVVATGVALVGQSRARADAELGKARAEAIVKFLSDDILANASPARIPDKHVRDTIVSVMLDPAVKSVGARFGHTPVIEAQVRDLLAQTYLILDRTDEAMPQAQRAFELRRTALGEDHPETFISLNTLAAAYKATGDLHRAEALHRRAMEGRLRVLGPDHRETLTSINNLANLVGLQDRLNEAEALNRRALEGYRRTLGPDDPYTLTSMNNLATVLKQQGKLDEAEAIFREVLEIYRVKHGDQHPRTLTVMNNLASLLRSRKNHAEAETLFRHVLETRREVLGETHSATLSAMHNLAIVLNEQKELDEAEPLMRSVLEGRRKTVGDDDVRTLSAMNNLVAVLVQRGDADAAIPLLQELHARVPNSQLSWQDAASYMSNGGRALQKMGRVEPAEPLLREAERILRANNESSGRAMHDVLESLAKVCEKTNRPEEAARIRAELETIPAPATAPATTEPASTMPADEP